MLRIIITIVILFLTLSSCNPKLANGLRKKDLNKDVEMITDRGTMIIRLSDATPLHRDNFLKLVKQHFYDGILFHRVIKNFMIQAGDASTAMVVKPRDSMQLKKSYTIAAEFVPYLFHQKGVIAAARMGDEVNPTKASSGSQFYIVQGKVFTDKELDSVEIFRMQGRKLAPEHREIYKTIGGAPHLDMNYTVFGTVTSGLSVVDKIASEPTSGRQAGDKPIRDCRIIRAFLVKRK